MRTCQQVDDSLLRRYAALLPRHELSLAEEARDAAARKHRVLARALVRCTLSRYLSRGDPTQVGV